MIENFMNPITMSFGLLEDYRNILVDHLQKAGLDNHDVQQVCKGLEVDQGLFLSINRQYLSGKTSFRQYCTKNNLAKELPDMFSTIKRLLMHQEKGIQAILDGHTTIISTGTGSGKTETFLIPILDHCLKNPGSGVKALILYPMNALANDQVNRLEQAIKAVPGLGIRYALYTGETSQEERNRIRIDPPDILITNYVMLDWMLTRLKDRWIFKQSSQSLRFLVLDEIHTYRGNRATHIKYLLARLKVLLVGPLVQVGTSATLRSHAYEGYLQSDSSERLNRFICPLLEVSEFSFIEPEYVPEPLTDHPNHLNYIPDISKNLGWSLSIDNDSGLSNLSNLTGVQYQQVDLFGEEDFVQSALYQDVANNPFVLALRQTLIQKGAQSFTDLVSLATQLLPEPTLTGYAVDMTKAYLSAIMFVNHLTGEFPLLDLRVHLFLRDIGGSLKRCIKCHKYHSGQQEYCQDCGFPLFLVYRKNINQCIGKVSGNRLKWELRPETDDRKNSFYVLISNEFEPGQGDVLTFQDNLLQDKEEIILDYEEYGRLKLTHLPIIDYGEVLLLSISLSDERKDYQYLFGLVSKLLSYQKTDQHKLLGFVDNREKASQYAIVLQDEFANEFFEAFLALHYPIGREIDLETTLELLHEQIPDPKLLSSTEYDLFQELDLWYCRSIGSSPRKFVTKVDRLRLKSFDNLSDLERDLINIFLNERAIALRFTNSNFESQYIRFWKYLSNDRVGIYLDETNRSDLPGFPGISLGSQGSEYREFIVKYGTSLIRQAVEALTLKNILIQDNTKDGKIHYYLSPKAVYLYLPASRYKTYTDLKRDLLLTSAVHSSEIKGDKRKQIEERFQKNDINFLCATPTLELGIDIGRLQMVLMLGVPPMPSNYAQRAGRAGRDTKNKFALIVTFCHDDNPHDAHFFANPKQMIDGTISPPVFNSNNFPIVEKHVNALVLAEHIDSRQNFSLFIRNIDQEILEAKTTVKRLFSVDSGGLEYLCDHFKDNVILEEQYFNQRSGGKLQHFLYAHGFFPEHTFRRDQVYVISQKNQIELELESDLLLTDIALTERDPESAYHLLVPEQKIFMAGDLYKITAKGKYKEISLPTTPPTRSYSVFIAEQELRFATKDKIRSKYLLKTSFDNPEVYQEKGKVIGLAYSPNCTLTFINSGVERPQGEQHFKDNDQEFQLGYQLQRQALILRFDKKICYQKSTINSLVAALNRTIIDGYGLDDAEIRIVSDALPIESSPEKSDFSYMILYDASGNGNIPLKRIFDEFDQVVAYAFRKLIDCLDGQGQPCKTGCYTCLRSYYTQYAVSDVDKPTALMFLGYLLEKNPFIPSLQPFEETSDHFDLTLKVQRQGDQWVVQGFRQGYTTKIGDDQNQALFDLLVQTIQAEFSTEMKSLKIIASDAYIVDAINMGRIKKNRGAFAHLQFQLLRFRHIHAERGG